MGLGRAGTRAEEEYREGFLEEVANVLTNSFVQIAESFLSGAHLSPDGEAGRLL